MVSVGMHIEVYFNDRVLFAFCIAVCISTQESGNESEVTIGLSK